MALEESSELGRLGPNPITAFECWIIRWNFKFSQDFINQPQPPEQESMFHKNRALDKFIKLLSPVQLSFNVCREAGCGASRAAADDDEEEVGVSQELFYPLDMDKVKDFTEDLSESSAAMEGFMSGDTTQPSLGTSQLASCFFPSFN